MEVLILGILLFFLIGVILSLLGSGGSILTIPVLVYIFKIDPYWATSYSMFIMGISNWTATIDNIKKGNIYYKIGLYIAIPGLIVTFLIRRFLLPAIPVVIYENETITLTKGAAIMMVFSVLIFITAIKTLRSKDVDGNHEVAYRPFKSGLQGAGIGLVTGFVGAGGGFLIVPALVFTSKLPMRKAIATSLFVISITTTLGFLGDLNSSIKIEWGFLLFYTTCAVIGVLIANRIKDKFSNKTLRIFFGYFILALSLLVFFIEKGKLGF